MLANPALNLAPFGRWTLRDKAAQRRLALRWASEALVPGAVVKKGKFLYSGAVECDLCIVLSPVRFGSGDYEDSPEFANDVESPTYYIYFGSTIERGKFNAGAGGYPSLSEAMAAVEHAAGIGPTVRWGHDDSAQVEQEKNQ